MGQIDSKKLTSVDQARLKVLELRKGNGLLSSAEQEEMKALEVKVRSIK